MKATLTLKQGRTLHSKDVDGDRKGTLVFARDLARYARKSKASVLVHFEDELYPIRISA